ncbi:MAG: S-layer homology domain-containing protein, partial [Tissierellia bacterium]|nr:S-layer homology domain-containing protein [Tissierellia bacterium]
LDDVKEQHTAEEAEKAARDLFALGNDYKMSYSNFGNYMATQGVYTWSMSFNGPNDEYVSVTLLANDLTLVNYSSYDSNSYVNPTEQVQNKNADSYVSIANNFLTEKGKVRLEDLEISYRSNNSQSDFNHQVSYVRKYKEDIFIYSDTITVTINKKEDKVTNYYREWDFELVEDALTDSFGITKDEAFEILKENYGFNLVYRRDAVESNGTPVKLFYEFDSSGVYPNFFQRFLVNGENGDVIDYEGEKVILQDKIVYSDLDQAQRPNIIEEMAENNIGFYEPELKPKQAITQIELFKLFLGSNGYSFGGRDLTDEQVYEMLQYNNLLEDEPKEPNKIITQKDIARYIARYKSYGNIGKLNEIFKDKYEDSTSSDKDFGYLAIAKEKGFIETDGENKLNPDKEITRETALYYLYAIKKDK